MLEIRLRFLTSFLTFLSLFSLIGYFVRFSNNNKRHLLKYRLTRELALTVNNEDNIVTFNELEERSSFLKIAAQLTFL